MPASSILFLLLSSPALSADDPLEEELTPDALQPLIEAPAELTPPILDSPTGLLPAPVTSAGVWDSPVGEPSAPAGRDPMVSTGAVDAARTNAPVAVRPQLSYLDGAAAVKSLGPPEDISRTFCVAAGVGLLLPGVGCMTGPLVGAFPSISTPELPTPSTSEQYALGFEEAYRKRARAQHIATGLAGGLTGTLVTALIVGWVVTL